MNLARMIDHTLLRPDATREQIHELCKEAIEHDFYAVCVSPYWISTAKSFLKDRDIKVCTVVGFPLGSSMSKTKTIEAKSAVDAGADEIDMVMNIGAALDARWNFVEHEIHEVVSTVSGKMVKVILEICLLNREQIVQACKIAEKAGAQFVKTSTGFGPSGATEEAVKLMKESISPQMGVKASGGIKNRITAEAMIAAGATRLGCTSSVAIITS